MDKIDRELLAAVLFTIAVSSGLGGLIGYGIGINQPPAETAYDTPVPVAVNMNVAITNASYYEVAWLALTGTTYEADPNETYFAICYSFVTEPNATLVVQYHHQPPIYPESRMIVDAYSLSGTLMDIQWSIYPHAGDYSCLTVYRAGYGYALFLGHASRATDVVFFGVFGLSAVAYMEA